MTQKMPVSYSRLSTYEQCGRKFEYLYVLKQVQDQGSEATAYGTRVHEALEKVAKGEGQHTDESAPFSMILASIMAQPGAHYYEFQMSVNAQLQPCDWFAPDVWVRSIADVLVVNGANAWIGDYKTGKVKDDPTQLQLFAWMVFTYFPEVQVVKTSFLWLKTGDITNMRFTRQMMPHLWSALATRFDRLQESVDTGFFKPKPSPLCGWCPAQDICPDAKPRRR
jgi:hypothetical protein